MLFAHLNAEIATGHKSIEVVTSDVGVEGEGGGDLGGGVAWVGSHVEIDVAAGRVAEGGGHGRHR